MFWILTSLSALSWVSKSFRQDIGQFHSPWIKPCKSADHSIKVIVHIVVDVKKGESKNFSEFQLGKVLYIYQKTFFMKNLTDLPKTVEIGMDPRLRWAG